MSALGIIGPPGFLYELNYAGGLFLTVAFDLLDRRAGLKGSAGWRDGSGLGKNFRGVSRCCGEVQRPRLRRPLSLPVRVTLQAHSVAERGWHSDEVFVGKNRRCRVAANSGSKLSAQEVNRLILGKKIHIDAP